MRLGLLSTAKINDEIIAGAAGADGVDIVAVGSRDAARADAYAAEKGIGRAHGTYDELLADDGVDAVYVSLPNGMHHEWTMRALAAGKHVLCEKPYTRNPAEVEEAFTAADAAGLVLMEAFMYRHHPQTSQVAGLVAEGVIGRLVSVMAAFSFRLEDLSDVRALPELDGGALMDLGCYCVSNSRVLGGEPVSASAVQVTGTSGIDMSLFGMLQFEDDVVSQFVASFSAPRRQYLEVVGEQGVIRVQAPWRVDWPGELELVRNGTVETLEVEEANSYTEQLVNMAAAIAGSAPARLGRDDALGQARAIDALYSSAESGSTVEL